MCVCVCVCVCVCLIWGLEDEGGWGVCLISSPLEVEMGVD